MFSKKVEIEKKKDDEKCGCECVWRGTNFICQNGAN